MAYDEGLAKRLRELFSDRANVIEKKIFGGLCFMVRGYMCCGVLGDTLMARIGVVASAECLSYKHVKEMDLQASQ